ncbi:MAG: phage major capsid protein [Oscillospiraceae bacterium]|nr:phage major capsid protein [Oscillospiraceae bacterium]
MAAFETLKLDKGLYRSNLGINAELERIDPSENYKGTALEGLDAFERQLKRFDIKIKGKNSSPIEKFFQTSDSAVLFPEYVSRTVRQGIEEIGTVDSIIAARTDINGLDYRTIASLPEKTSLEEIEEKFIGEGEVIPETQIKTKDNLVKLHKRGKMLVASYEALRFQRLDIFSIALKEIGAYLARVQTFDALNTIVAGDGNENPAQTISCKSEGSISYADLVTLWSSLHPYTMNTIVTSPKMAADIMCLPEMRDAAAGLNFHATGKTVTPLGANLITTKELGDALIVFDKNYALEMVTAGGIVTDFDKLIDRQLERAAITQTYGFAKLFDDAALIMEA